MKDEKLIDEYAELVAKFKAGDMSAFGELYERTHRMVYATCLGILQNEDDAFDVMQETYIKANETLDTLKDNRAFIAWLNKIASNKALTLVKKKRCPVLALYYGYTSCLYDPQHHLRCDHDRVAAYKPGV